MVVWVVDGMLRGYGSCNGRDQRTPNLPVQDPYTDSPTLSQEQAQQITLGIKTITCLG
jgi:hypothetical protein